MNAKVKEAIAELEKLPADEQDQVAEAILDFAARDDRPQLTEAQAEEVGRRLSERAPRFLTLAEVRAHLLRSRE